MNLFTIWQHDRTRSTYILSATSQQCSCNAAHSTSRTGAGANLDGDFHYNSTALADRLPLQQVVSMACFVVHCISAPSSGSPKDNSFMDRGLEPMAFGGDMLLQTGLLVAFSAFIFVNVIMMLTLDILGALLLILVFFISWPESFGGLPLALFILVLLDIILHLVMLGQRETTSTWVSPGRTSIDIRKMRHVDHCSPSQPPRRWIADRRRS